MNQQLKIVMTITLILLGVCALYPSSYSKLDNFDSISVFQLSNQHCGNASDSVVLTRNTNEDFYNEISIYRNKKLIFRYSEKDLQVMALPYSLFVEQEISFCKEYFYIFKLFNAPSPDRYLILKTTEEKTFLFGITEPNSAIIFGDVDFDGKFEIGGFSDWCEVYDNHTCPDPSLYIVFEVDSGFPEDEQLTNYFRTVLNK